MPINPGFTRTKKRKNNTGKRRFSIQLDADIFRFVERRSVAKSEAKAKIIKDFLRLGIKEFCRRVEANKQKQN